MKIILKSRGVFFKVLMAAFAALFCSIGYANTRVTCGEITATSSGKCISLRITPNTNGRLYFSAYAEVSEIMQGNRIVCRFRVINQTTNTVVAAKTLSADLRNRLSEHNQTLRGLPIRHRYVVEVNMESGPGEGSFQSCFAALDKNTE